MIDTKRSRVTDRPFFDVDPTAIWEAGQVATLKSVGGKVVVKTCKATEVPLGIFWRPKAVAITKTEKEEVILSGTDPSPLKHGNIESGSELVTDETETTVYVRDTDYSINYTNGLIARIATGGIPDGAKVIVTYRYNIPASEMAFQPQRFERVPDATLGSGKIVVITGHAIIYTDQFDTSQTYSLNDPLYVNDDGRLTSQNTGSLIVGKVLDIPTVGYPLIAIELKPTII